ncbi:MAG: hypothetical protein LBU27_08225 [Candidatus Peribacteria bacterium]|jgi:hypothetical protein|nr:hypothetical protein [Candidatus Peribacteria bacterium]
MGIDFTSIISVDKYKTGRPRLKIEKRIRKFLERQPSSSQIEDMIGLLEEELETAEEILKSCSGIGWFGREYHWGSLRKAAKAEEKMSALDDAISLLAKRITP